MEEIEFNPVDSASAGALGKPGHRVFMIQARKADVAIGVVVEKQQVELLASQSIEFLDALNDDFPEEIVASPDEFEVAGSIEPIEPLFRARSMGLIFDPERKLVTLELRELASEDEQPVDDEKIVRFTMTRSQLRAMAVRGNESVNAGREPCPLCLNPMDESGHVCPRLN